MTAVSQIHQPQHIQTADVEAMTASWPDLLQRPIRDASERREIAIAVDVLTAAPRREWVMGRVAALLSQYYAADIPQAMVQMMAEDWEFALRDYPEWAITAAVRWWKSAENKDRKRKPLEGDIAARAKTEMGVVRIAEMAMRRFDRGDDVPNGPEVLDPVVSKERAAEIMREVGFDPKRFGGGA